MSNDARYSCTEVTKEDATIMYAICDPQGVPIAELKDFGQTETLLAHLNGLLSKLKPKAKRKR